MNFGIDGPVVTGWWVNPRTGDKFNAIDTFIEDNNLLIKTSDGRLLKYSQIQDYIQSGNNEPTMMTPQVKIQSAANDSIPPEILAELESPEDSKNDLLIPDDNIYSTPKQMPLGNIYQEPIGSPSIKDYDIIDRALSKKNKPDISPDLLWRGFPKKEIEMLIDVMGVSEDAVAEYYINGLSIDEIIQAVSESIKLYIIRELHPITESPIIEEKKVESIVTDKSMDKKKTIKKKK